MAKNRDAIRQSRSKRNIMRDENERHPVFPHQPLQKGCYFLLHDSIERTRRLIGNQKARVCRDGERNRDALLLPAGKLVRIAVKALIRCRNMYTFQKRDSFCPRLPPAGVFMSADRLDKLRPDRHQRIKT